MLNQLWILTRESDLLTPIRLAFIIDHGALRRFSSQVMPSRQSRFETKGGAPHVNSASNEACARESHGKSSRGTRIGRMDA
eukprot:scaffold889_cov268-Pinguiococcus_pyrenoidosus.AAC.10